MERTNCTSLCFATPAAMVWKTSVAPAVTTYNAQLSANPRRLDVTYPDGTQISQLMNNHPNSFDDQLPYSQLTYDASGTLIQQIDTDWQQGDDGSPLVYSIQVTNPLKQTAKTEYAYLPPNNQLVIVSQLDFDETTVLRSVQTDYESSPEYAKRHIFNLPKVVQIFGPSGQVSYTEYAYDGQPLSDTPGVMGHSEVFDQYAPGHQLPGDWVWDCPYDGRGCKRIYEPGGFVSDYDPLTNFRGNITTVTRYADAGPPRNPITETRLYDIDGNMTTMSSSCCEQTSFSYIKDTQYAYPSVITRGSATGSPAIQISSSYTYDFNTGLLRTITDPNNRTAKWSYDDATLRVRQVDLPTGASLSDSYDDVNQFITETVWDAAGVAASQRKTYLNGIGLVSSEQSLTGDNTWNVVDTEYDSIGRMWRFSHPYRSPQQPLWNVLSYDALGRVNVFQGADGSAISTFYDDGTRPSSSDGMPGSTVLNRDPWGRERWLRSDALGQLTEVVEPDANGNGKVTDANNVVTHYTYDTLGRLVRIVQGSDKQERVFAYDSLGRLTAEKLPEKSPTLSSTGIYVGTSGTCSDVFTYDDRSNLTSHTDARGIKTVYDYGDDPLNRLQAISYDMSGFKDTGHVVTPAAPSTFKYMPDGDVTRPVRVETQLEGWRVVEEYGYDAEGRLSSKAVTFPTRPSLIVGYDYDTLSRLAHLAYPIENGTTSAVRKITYGYGTGGHITDLMLDGVELASQFNYNSADQITSFATGPAGPRQVWETYGYDSGSGFLSDQRVVGASSKLLDVTYGYRPSNTSAITRQLIGVTDNLHPEKNRSFGYDAIGRLKQAIGGNSNPYHWTELYKYDSYGNRTSVQGSGNSADGSQIPTDGARDLSYDVTTNHVNSPGFTYDAAGNQTGVLRANGSLGYRYDAANRLSVVLDGAGNAVEVYWYGADSRRLMRVSAAQPSAPTFYAWDVDQVLAEYTQAFDSLIWSKSFIYLGDRILAARTGSVARYYHPDYFGNRLVTNDQDPAVIEQVTLPFGTVIDKESSGTFNPIFKTYDRNAATGLDYAVNRTYDHEGQFTQSDPAELGAVNLGNPQSLNLYSYVANDPVNRTDPTGLDGTQYETVVVGERPDSPNDAYFFNGSATIATPGGFSERRSAGETIVVIGHRNAVNDTGVVDARLHAILQQLLGQTQQARLQACQALKADPIRRSENQAADIVNRWNIVTNDPKKMADLQNFAIASAALAWTYTSAVGEWLFSKKAPWPRVKSVGSGSASVGGAYLLYNQVTQKFGTLDPNKLNGEAATGIPGGCSD